MAELTYIDSKGRTRWHKNDEVGEYLKKLGTFLVVGGYPEDHAARYPKLAHAISRMPESIEELHAEGRLEQIPGVGDIVANIIGEYLDRGSSTKWDEWAKETPVSVLELAEIPGLGPKMIRTLYAEHGVRDLAGLRKALESGALNGVPGIGPKTLKSMREAAGL
jgi:DNA polymerase (family 10)